MADITFGTAVQEVLSNIQQDTSDADSIHAHRARRALIQAMQRNQDEEFHFTQRDGQFQSDAGGYEYTLSQKFSRHVRRPIRVWTTDGATEKGADAELSPPHEDGAQRLDWNEVMRRVRNSTTNQDYIDSWAWHEKRLWVAPRLDGVVHIVVRYIYQATTFGYVWDGSAWVYNTSTGAGSDNTYTGTAIDAVVDRNGWLQRAYRLVVNEATRDLFLGPYAAKDPKKSLAETWIARRNDEFDRLVRNEMLGSGPQRVEPYMLP